jgi:hypothetical protein
MVREESSKISPSIWPCQVELRTEDKARDVRARKHQRAAAAMEMFAALAMS